MAPDKGTDPGQERPEPQDALDRWARKSGGDGDGDGAEDKDGEQKDDAGKKKKSVFSNPWVKYGGIALLIVLVIAGIVWWLIARQYEDTDDAFIDTHIVHISPQIAGQVIAVRGQRQPDWCAGASCSSKSIPPTPTTRLIQSMAQEAQAETQ